MIRREEKEGWILINQHDHAELAGDIMAYWGNDKFTRPEPYEEVIFAIREHDNGWKDWDSSPRINPENRYPMNFMEMDFPDQERIWTSCFKRHAAEHPYASALIALHFRKFNGKVVNKNPNNSRAKTLCSEMNDFISRTLKIKVSDSDSNSLPEEVKTNLRLVQIGDVISLALCHGWSSIEINDVPLDYNGSEETLSITSDDGNNFVITPYPFSQPSMRFSIRGRRINQKRFSNDEELRQKLRESPYETLDFSIRSEIKHYLFFHPP
jgi:hypothetical protein